MNRTAEAYPKLNKLPIEVVSQVARDERRAMATSSTTLTMAEQLVPDEVWAAIQPC
jgi:hypothetical protein